MCLQLNELRTSLSRAEQQAAWREDHLRQEVADVQQVPVMAFSLALASHMYLYITCVAVYLFI